MSEQDGINYDALAKAHYVAGKQLFGMTEDVLWGGATEHAKQQSRYKARAVIASYLDQRAARGFVECRAADVAFSIALIEMTPFAAQSALPNVMERLDRMRAALAAHAPGATEEP